MLLYSIKTFFSRCFFFPELHETYMYVYIYILHKVLKTAHQFLPLFIFKPMTHTMMNSKSDISLSLPLSVEDYIIKRILKRKRKKLQVSVKLNKKRISVTRYQGVLHHTSTEILAKNINIPNKRLVYLGPIRANHKMVKNVTYKPKEYQTHYQNILLHVYILGH